MGAEETKAKVPFCDPPDPVTHQHSARSHAERILGRTMREEKFVISNYF